MTCKHILLLELRKIVSFTMFCMVLLFFLKKTRTENVWIQVIFHFDLVDDRPLRDDLLYFLVLLFEGSQVL